MTNEKQKSIKMRHAYCNFVGTGNLSDDLPRGCWFQVEILTTAE